LTISAFGERCGFAVLRSCDQTGF